MFISLQLLFLEDALYMCVHFWNIWFYSWKLAWTNGFLVFLCFYVLFIPRFRINSFNYGLSLPLIDAASNTALKAQVNELSVMLDERDQV